MEKVKKHRVGKIIGRVLIGLMIAALLFLLVTFIVHRVIRSREYDRLNSMGLTNPISVGDYSLNVCSYGNENSEHTLVAISGMGVSDYSVTLRNVTDSLAGDNLIVFVDRAGYGLSDDTAADQTTERIVEDYRAALKNAGIEAPYVLLPHSLGGVYATYWESKYPDEIEGIAFIDATELDENAFAEEEPPGLTDTLETLACKVGLHRPVLHKYFYELPYETYTDEQRELSDMLIAYNCSTFAMLSEDKLIADNCKTAYDSIVTNDIPKVYICSSWYMPDKEAVREYFDWINKQVEHTAEQPVEYTDELAETLVKQSEESIETTLMPYLEKLGNCEFVGLSGDHMIYQQKPTECAEIIKDFLEKVEET